MLGAGPACLPVQLPVPRLLEPDPRRATRQQQSVVVETRANGAAGDVPLPAPFHELFGVAPTGVSEWAMTSVLAVAIFLLVEVIKALARRRERETERAPA